jgi:hypothetical protein
MTGQELDELRDGHELERRVRCLHLEGVSDVSLQAVIQEWQHCWRPLAGTTKREQFVDPSDRPAPSGLSISVSKQKRGISIRAHRDSGPLDSAPNARPRYGSGWQASRCPPAVCATMPVVKRTTAMARLGDVGEGLERSKQWPGTRVLAACVWGEFLDASIDVERIQLVFAVDLPAAEVPWMSRPAQCEALASFLRLDKLPLSWCWRPAEWPVWITRSPEPSGSGQSTKESIATRWQRWPRATSTRWCCRNRIERG